MLIIAVILPLTLSFVSPEPSSIKECSTCLGITLSEIETAPLKQLLPCGHPRQGLSVRRALFVHRQTWVPYLDLRRPAVSDPRPIFTASRSSPTLKQHSIATRRIKLHSNGLPILTSMRRHWRKWPQPRWTRTLKTSSALSSNGSVSSVRLNALQLSMPFCSRQLRFKFDFSSKSCSRWVKIIQCLASCLRRLLTKVIYSWPLPQKQNDANTYARSHVEPS